jgi:hypothetical protein
MAALLQHYADALCKSKIVLGSCYKQCYLPHQDEGCEAQRQQQGAGGDEEGRWKPRAQDRRRQRLLRSDVALQGRRLTFRHLGSAAADLNAPQCVPLHTERALHIAPASYGADQAHLHHTL